MTTAVLLSAHGTVDHLDELPAFLAKIRRGRPTPQSILDEVRHRFELIGGSPLLRITREVAAALQARLGLPVVVGMRLWTPTLTSALAEAAAHGATRIVSIPLAPQSTHVYHQALQEAVQERVAAGHAAPELVLAPAWGEEPLLLDAFSEAIDDGLTRFDAAVRDRVPVVLTAHSLPRRVIAMGDPYEQQFRAMAEAVIARRGEAARLHVAFQSQGMDGGEWLGPDLPTTFRTLAAAGHHEVLVAAIGFVSDHVETLYDLDLEAHTLAEAAGLRLQRAPSLNTRPRYLDALEAVARRLL